MDFHLLKITLLLLLLLYFNCDSRTKDEFLLDEAMADPCVGPSHLHLKKELNALQKATFLQDPKAFSNWGSSLYSSTPSPRSPYCDHAKGARINTSPAHNKLKSPLSCRKRSKVHLCNWVNHLSNSSDSGIKSNRGMAGGGGGTQQSKVLYNTEQSNDSEHSKPERPDPHKHDRSNSCNSYGCHDYGAVRLQSLGSSPFKEVEIDPLQQNEHQNSGVRLNWSRRIKEWDCGSSYSSSISNTPRRRANLLYNMTRSCNSSESIDFSRSPQSLQSLHCYYGEETAAIVNIKEFLTNIAELDLEASSQLDQRRLSTDGKNRAKLDVVQHGEAHTGMFEQEYLSEKYRPRSFHDIVGQSSVIQSLQNAISSGNISTAYLFHGPRGTGKTSTARAFAAALNCSSTEENRPCRCCSKCIKTFSSQNESSVREINGNEKNGWLTLKYMLKNMMVAGQVEQYTVVVIEDCHKIPGKLWSELSYVLEDPPSHAVFIFITTNPARVPIPILSQCQKYLFLRLKETDILGQLHKLCVEEDIGIKEDALKVIAFNSDGSLRKAETMLDQLNLVGHLSSSSQNEHVSLVSDETLLDLLNTAMSSDSLETVKKSDEVLNSGVAPVALISRLAGLLIDMIAETFNKSNCQRSGTNLTTESFTGDQMEMFEQAMKILFQAKKHPRFSGDQKAWFTAVLLQLGSCNIPSPSNPSSSIKQNIESSNLNGVNKANETLLDKKSSDSLSSSALTPKTKSRWFASHQSLSSYSSSSEVKLIDTSAASTPRCRSLADMNFDEFIGNGFIRCLHPGKWSMIWKKCIKRCQSENLRKFLAHGRLILIAQAEGAYVVYVAVTDDSIKDQATRFQTKITNLIEEVLKHKVKVLIFLVPDASLKALESVPNPSPGQLRKLIAYVNNEGEITQKEYGLNASQSFGRERLPKMTTAGSNSVLQRHMERCDSIQLEEQDSGDASLLISSEEKKENCNTNSTRKSTSLEKRSNLVDDQRKDFLWKSTSVEKQYNVDDGQRMDFLWNLTEEHRETIILNQKRPGVRCSNRDDFLQLLSEAKEDQVGKRNDDSGEISEIHSHEISPSLLHRNSSKAKDHKQQSLDYELEPGHDGEHGITSSSQAKRGSELSSKEKKRLLCFTCCG